MKIRTTHLLATGAVLGLSAGTASAANVALSSNGAVASHVNSQDVNFGFSSAMAIDDDLGTMNHTDFDGSFGGDPALPDILRVDFAGPADLTDITIFNRDTLGNGSLSDAQRLEGATVQAFDASDVQVGSTGTVAGAGLSTIHVFDNGGAGYANVSYITLTNNNWIHILEFQANEVPEPGSLALIGLGGLLMLRRRRS